MKYQKLHKLNSKGKKNGKFCFPAEDYDDDNDNDQHMMRRNKLDGEDENNVIIHRSLNNDYNSQQQKVRKLTRTINRVISMTRVSGKNSNADDDDNDNNKGQLQLQKYSPPRPTNNDRYFGGFDVDDRVVEDLERFKNYEKQQRNPQALPPPLLPVVAASASWSMGLDQLEEDFEKKFKNHEQSSSSSSTPAAAALAPGRNLSFDQLEEDFEKFKNIHEQQQAPRTPARSLSFYNNYDHQVEEDFGMFKNQREQLTPARSLSFDQLEEDFKKLKNGSSATPWLFKSRMDA